MKNLQIVLALLLAIVVILIAIAAWSTFTLLANITLYLIILILIVGVGFFTSKFISDNLVDTLIKIEAWKQSKETTYSMELGNQATEIELSSYAEVINQNMVNHYIYTKKMLGTSFGILSGGKAPPHELIEASEPKPLLETIGHLPRIVVVGGMGSGKTNTILHLAKRKADDTEVHVFDSHSSPKKWPQGLNVSVVGTGRDYTSIAEDFTTLLNLMDQRYEEIGKGEVEESTHPPITLVADEWTLLPELVPNLQSSARSLFTEGRKASIGFVIAVHDLTVGALGLKGFSNLRESFDCIVYCEHDVQTNNYVTDVQWGWGTNRPRERMIPPDKYDARPVRETIEVEPEDEEPIIIDLSQPNVKRLPSIPSNHSIVLDAYSRMVNSSQPFSWNQLAKSLYGKKGGTYNDKVREILDQYGIDYTMYL